MTEEALAIYDASAQVFKVFDIKTKGVMFTVKEHPGIGTVNGLQLEGHTLVYIKARNIIVHDISTEDPPKVIQRDSLLRTVALKNKLVAVGDDFGKIYLVHLGSKSVTVQTLHWHAHRVHSLLFVPETPYLLSAGEESVVVQWHLET